MKIRNAIEDDLDAMLDMGVKYYATTSYAKSGDCDPEAFRFLFGLVKNSGILLVIENTTGELVGMAALIISPFMFNRSVIVASEIVWWIDPSKNATFAVRSLMKEIEAQAKEKRATKIQMQSLPDGPDSVGSLYERFGYIHSETCYTKEI